MTILSTPSQGSWNRTGTITDVVGRGRRRLTSVAVVVTALVALAAPASGSSPTPTVADAQKQLVAAWKADLHKQPATATAAVYDETTKTLTVLNPQVRLLTASTIKVFVAVAVLRRTHGKPNIATRALLTRMITRSDNAATDTLWTATGRAAGLQGVLKAAGLHQTHPGSGMNWGLTTTSAADQVSLLRQVRSGPLLTGQARRLLLTLMSEVIPAQRWGVTAGVSRRTPIALKNGWLPVADGWHLNTMGLISGSHKYEVAILTGRDKTYVSGVALADKLAITAAHYLPLLP